MSNSAIKFSHNPVLLSPAAPKGWKGTPLDGRGKFRNIEHPFTPRWVDVMRWKLFQKNPYKELKKTDLWNPVVHRDTNWLEESNDIIVWLGHCTFYIRFNGICIITDPVFGDIFPLKRKSDFPIDANRVVGLDYVLLSHDHRDHLDKPSLSVLSKNNPEAQYLTGLKMQPLVKQFTGSKNIQESGWYQQFNTDHKIEITFIPARHWSRRSLNDTNKRLWGGFVIKVGAMKLFFGGDSAYDLHYKHVGKLFGPFNFAFLGIGAYEPRWFMKTNHQSPAEAVKGFQELTANYLIPMHYGAFDLSDEPLSQPLNDLYVAAQTEQVKDKLRVLEIGKPLNI